MDRMLVNPVLNAIGASFEFIYKLSPYVDKTVVLVPQFVHDKVTVLSDSIGFDVETFRYTLGMFLCYPLGFLMLLLPYGKLKHLFSFVMGCFLLQFTIGSHWIHQLITSLVAYVMFLLLPPKIAKTAVPVFLMIYLTAGHIHRQYIDYLGWELDFTGTQMVLTMKLYSFAYNLYDGYMISRGKENRASKKCADVAIEKLPGIIEFLGYTFCFATILVGPAYEYKTYAGACDGSKMYDKNGKPRGKIPGWLLPTIKPFVVSVICLATFVIGNSKFPLLDPTDPQNFKPVLLRDEFLQKPWLHRYLYSWFALFCIRQRYYFAWKNSEGASNIWYAGFDGFDKNGNAIGWESSSNIDILDFETAPNVKTLSAAWNKKTASWLSKYVYIRTGGSLLATYGMSAFWHGFYPGYYLFFLSVPLLTYCERIGRTKLTPRFCKSGKKWSPYGILAILSTSLFVEYMVLPFQLLSLEWSLACWKSHYFFGHIACILFYLFVSSLSTPREKTL